jgi:hypothetical protein
MRLTYTLLPAVITLTISGIASADVILTASASPNPVNVGDATTVAVTLSDNASSNSVAGFQFDLDFNPAVLQETSVTEEGYFQLNGVLGLNSVVVNNTAGTITMIDDAAGTPEDPGAGDPLADIAFTAIAPGSSPITITNAIISNGQSVAIPNTTADTTVNVQTITAVPEPGTGTLGVLALALGLSALVVGRARNRRWDGPAVD